MNWLNKALEFGGGFRFIQIYRATSMPFILLIFKNKWTEISIIYCTERKHITDEFNPKPWLRTAFNMLEI